MIAVNFKSALLGLAVGLSLASQALGREPAPVAPKIESVEQADKVLAEASRQRAEIESRFKAENAACMEKFYVSGCMEAAKEKRRRALAVIRPGEVEAGLFKRRANVAEKDRQLAEKREQAERNARAAEADAASKPPRREPAAAPKEDPAAEAAKVAQSQRRAAEHEAKMQRRAREDAEAAKKSAENIAAYNRKVAEAQAHQREVEQKKAEKEAELAKQKQQKEQGGK